MVIEGWGRPSSVPPPGMIPGQRYNGSRGVDYNHTPQLPPKPPGRTLMYVYEQPDGTTTYHTVNHVSLVCKKINQLCLLICCI